MPNATTSDAQYTDVVKKYRDVTLRPDHSARSDSTGRSRLAVSCDPVFYPDVISLLITTNEVNNVIGCRSLSRVHQK